MRSHAKLLLADVEISLGVTAELESRVHPGEQTYSERTNGPVDASRLRKCLTGAGFSWVTDDDRGAGGFVFVCFRGSTIVSINFSGSPWNVLHANGIDREAVPKVAIVDGEFEWHEGKWPAYFDEGRIMVDDPTTFMVDAEIEDAESTLARYRAWAFDRGFEIEDPLNAWEAEPDMRTSCGLRFANEDVSVHVSIEEERLSLYFTTVP